MAGVFISYRRDDSGPWAGRLRDRLAGRLGESNVFFDIDSIDLGLDYRAAIESRLRTCDVSVVLIGPAWLARAADGSRRIDEPTDLHRIEVATAFRLGLRVIPVLVGGAHLPSAAELPEDLQPLAFRQAIGVEHESFNRDVGVLEDALRRIEGIGRPAQRADALVVGGAPSVAPTAEPAPAPTPAPAPAPVMPASAPSPPPAGRRVSPIVMFVAVALFVAAAGAVIAALRGTGSGDAPTGTGNTIAVTAARTTSAPATSATTAASSSSAPSAAVELPDAALVYNRPVSEAMRLLAALGLNVRQGDIGCSNSTDPGFVRQVTAGRTQNVHIIYGKSTDTIDTATAAGLKAGDEVTVWTPSSNPC